MTERSDTQTLSGDMLMSSLESLGVRPAMAPGWSTSALGVFLPTPQEWYAGTPQIIGSNITRMVEGGETAMRIYAKNDNQIMARQKQTEGRFTGWARARHFALAEPIRAATVTEAVNVPIRGGRTLPVLRLMEHGNSSEEEFMLSLPDLARYVQREHVELTLT